MRDRHDQSTKVLPPERPRRGRPPIGKAMTAAERKAAQRARDAAAGQKVEEWTWESLMQQTQRAAAGGRLDVLAICCEELQRRCQEAAGDRLREREAVEVGGISYRGATPEFLRRVQERIDEGIPLPHEDDETLESNLLFSMLHPQQQAQIKAEKDIFKKRALFAGYLAKEAKEAKEAEETRAVQEALTVFD